MSNGLDNPAKAGRIPEIKVVAMPADANADGDIFGGWIMSQMDLAGGIIARDRANCRVVTIAVENMTFHLPVFIGDCVECYCEITRVGRTSIKVKIETWVERRRRRGTGSVREKVTEGEFIYVAIGEDRKPAVIGE